ncbi:MAG: hypothetical protein IT174_10590 [Acidobacteria bacterium]|nr:hypothetical protein [Acidobacteriota bacterium]
MAAPKRTVEENPVMDKEKALLLLGRIQATDRIANNLTAEVVRTLILIEECKAYRALGYQQFVDYLADSDVSVMTKHEFYNRKKLLETEGDELFDLFSISGIPLHKRKLLAAGQVEISAEGIYVHTDSGDVHVGHGETTRFIELVSALAKSNADKTKKLEKGKDDFRRLKERLLKIEDDPASGRTVSTFDQVHTVAIGGLAALAAELEQATEAELLQYADGQLLLLASQFNRINTLLSSKIGVDSIELLETDGDHIADLLND